MLIGIMLVVVLAFGVSAGYAKAGLRTVPAGKVGIVIKRFGRRHPDDDPLVAIHGSSGAQAQTLRGNTTYRLSPFLYRVKYVPQIHIPNGWIGVVVAKAGAIRPPGRPLPEHVECDYFRDGAKFLREGGQQGPQQQVLTSGNYEINTVLFEVISKNTEDVARREGLTAADLRQIEIPIGETGVVITHTGAGPDPDRGAIGKVVEGHESFQLPWEFLKRGGQLGVQEETLAGGGRYSINPWFAHVVRIPTRVLILEWTKDKKADSNLDISLDQIVLDVQGCTVRLDVKQTVRIPAEVAPRLVCRFGDSGNRGHTAGRASVREFVEKELAAIVAGYFRKISAHYKIQEFITKYDEVCNELAAEVDQALRRTGVEAIETVLEEFECDQPEINKLRRQIAEEQELVRLEQVRLAGLEARRDNEKVMADIEAGHVKNEEGRRRLDHMELVMLVEKLGAENVARERILAELVKVKVPDTQIIGGGNGDIADAMLSAMPYVQARDLLLAMFNESAGRNNNVPPAEPRQAVMSGQGMNELAGEFATSADPAGSEERFVEADAADPTQRFKIDAVRRGPASPVSSNGQT